MNTELNIEDIYEELDEEALYCKTIEKNVPEYQLTEVDYRDARNIAKTRAYHYIQIGWQQFQYADLLSAAYEGICEAAIRYDPYKGSLKETKFTSYAYFWIEKYIKEYIARNKSVVSGTIGECWTGAVPYASSIDAYDSTNNDGAGSDHQEWLGIADEAQSSLERAEKLKMQEDLLALMLVHLEPLEKLVVQLSVGIGTVDGNPMSVRQIARAIDSTKAFAQSMIDSAYSKLRAHSTEYAMQYDELLS